MSPIYTPGGLKIRLDAHRIDLVLYTARDKVNLQQAFLDLELWANFPNAFSSICTITTAFMTHSLMWTLAAFVIAFAGANVFQQFTYSRILNLLIPNFLGRWIISLPFSIATCVYLYFDKSLFVGFVQLIIVVANLLNYTDFMLFLIMPIRIVLKNLTGLFVGDVEIAFMQILSLQAKQVGIKLNWNL